MCPRPCLQSLGPVNARKYRREQPSIDFMPYAPRMGCAAGQKEGIHKSQVRPYFPPHHNQLTPADRFSMPSLDDADLWR